MKRNPFFRTYLAAVLALAGIYGNANASTVFWGSDFNNPVLLDSNGLALDGYFTFEIGSFGSFIPTFQNVDQWEANWKVFDRAFDPTPSDIYDGDPEGWNAEFQFFAGTVGHTLTGTSDSLDANPTDVFDLGEVAYLWVYNTKTISSGSEWALVTDGTNTPNTWRFPNPIDDLGSYDWNLATADTAIVGGVNDVRGDGTFSATPASFALQTATVPEPGSAFLLLAAAATHLIRRARRLTRALPF